MYWILALLSLSLAAAPATTKPAATKGKAVPAKAATKTVAKAAAPRVPAKTAPAKPGTRPTVATARTATPNRTLPANTARGRVQQTQYSRYPVATARNRRQLATNRTAPARPRPVYHPVQSAPTAERTKEIQSTLAQKGYLSGEPSGAWDADSITAMKRFQKDQNLDADGKLNSLSLIALGLGPKRTLTATSVNPPTAAPVPPRP